MRFSFHASQILMWVIQSVIQVALILGLTLMLLGGLWLALWIGEFLIERIGRSFSFHREFYAFCRQRFFERMKGG
jgi:hypothetical protein